MRAAPTAAAHPARSRLLTTAAVLLALLLAGAPADAQPPQSGTRVGESEDPVQASIELSQYGFADGEAMTAVLGRSDVFADNLAGAAITQAVGPLLLADPAPAGLRPEVEQELVRALGPAGGSCEDGSNADVLILGGTAAISEDVEIRVGELGYCPVRLAGSERVGTSVAVAGYRLGQFLTPDSSRGTLLIATAGNPADSASASAWAAYQGHPIVVTGSQSLDPQVADLIQPGDTAFEEIILLGGEAALSSQVEADVRAAAGDSFPTSIRRIAGQTRDDTAFTVATELWDNNSAGATIVEGFAPDFWTYALPGAATSARYQSPMLYVQTDFVPDTTDTYLRQHPVEFLYTVGPVSRISDATRESAEGSLGSGVQPDGRAGRGD